MSLAPFRIAFAAAMLPLLGACSTVGWHVKSEREKIDFSPDAQLKICAYREADVSSADVDELIARWDRELSLFKIKVVKVRDRVVERPGPIGAAMLNFLYEQDLEAPCDRLVYFQGRTAGDMAFEAFSLTIFALTGLKFEIHGAVETLTHTRGYIKARYNQLGQMLFTSPGGILIHEGYHLLGCGHAWRLTQCYQRIKEAKNLLRESPSDFFPAITLNGRVYRTRAQVNAVFNHYRAVRRRAR